MSRWQFVLLTVLGLGLLLLAVTTWGSIGSVMCVFCLIIMAVALLYRRFVLERDEDDFKMEL